MAHERHVIAMERMAAKHAREVQIALDKDRVERDGDLQLQTRKARQVEVKLLKVQGGHRIKRAIRFVVEGPQRYGKDHCAREETAFRDTKTLYVIVSPNRNSNPL